MTFFSYASIKTNGKSLFSGRNERTSREASICLEELISVVKGEQEENENSYLGLLFIADTVGKLNLFLTSVLTNKDVSVIGNKK